MDETGIDEDTLQEKSILSPVDERDEQDEDESESGTDADETQEMETYDTLRSQSGMEDSDEVGPETFVEPEDTLPPVPSPVLKAKKRLVNSKQKRMLNLESKDPDKKKESKSKRSGLQFPVSRIHRKLRHGQYAQRISPFAAIYLAATLEYLVAEVLEIAGNFSKEQKKFRITPRHIKLAFQTDNELDRLLGKVTIAQGGVLPYIHPILVPVKRKKVKSTNPDE